MQRNPPLRVCGAPALSAGHHGNSCNVEDPGGSAEGPKVLWATKPVLLIGKVLVTGPGTQNLFLLFLVREE